MEAGSSKGKRSVSCAACRRRHTTCVWLEYYESCSLCYRLAEHCSGPVRKSKYGVAENEAVELELTPSSTIAQLSRTTLRCALSFFLVDEFLKQFGTTIFYMDADYFLAVFKAAGGNTSHLPELQEIMALGAMRASAHVSVHSAILGEIVASQTPSLSSLSELASRSDLVRVGLARSSILGVLNARLESKLQNLSILGLPPPTAIKHLNIAMWGLNEAYAGGMISLRQVLKNARDLLLKAFPLRALVENGEHRHSLDATIDFLSRLEKNCSLQLNLPSVIPPVHTFASYPPLYPFSTEDVDFILCPKVTPQATDADLRAFLKRWSLPIYLWLDIFFDQAHTRWKQPDAFKSCSEISQRLFSYFDDQLLKVFDDPRFETVDWIGGHVTNLPRLASYTEAYVLKVILGRFVKMKDVEMGVQSERRRLVFISLNRLTQYCERMRSLLHAFTNPANYLSSLSYISLAVAQTPPRLLLEWCRDHPDANNAFRKSMMLASYAYPVAARLVSRLEDAASTAKITEIMMDGASVTESTLQGVSDAGSDVLSRNGQPSTAARAIVDAALREVDDLM